MAYHVFRSGSTCRQPREQSTFAHLERRDRLIIRGGQARVSFPRREGGRLAESRRLDRRTNRQGPR
eukprot:758618-Pyramimonas_sp.AAC.1